MNYHEEILDAIPHRPPMLLVDEIVERSDDRIVCRKRFRPDEFFLQGHYPDNPIVPGVILCEAAMQAGAILLAPKMRQSDGVPVVARMNNIKFRRIIRPGDRVDLEVNLTDEVTQTYFLDARIRHDGELACRFSYTCMMTVPPSSDA